MRYITLASLFFTTIASFGLAESGTGSYYEKILLEKNIKPTSEGLKEYFQQMHPSPEQKKRTAELLKQLGTSDSFAAREDAMAKLLVMPKLPSEALIEASEGPDPEIRWRAKKILQLGKPEADRVFYAALRTIEEKELQGIVDELIRVVPLCDQEHLRFAIRQAIQASASKADSALLKSSLDSENHQIRLAAIASIGKVEKENAGPVLLPFLQDKNEQIQLATARALANVGNRKSLSSLIKLCGSTNPNIRSISSLTLRQLTDESFGFIAYSKPDDRKAALEKWKTWLADKGSTAKLKFPLKPFSGSGSYLNGNTLIAMGYRNTVIEIDSSGKDIWTYNNSQGCWSAEKLSNGDVLIAEYSAGRVVQVDRDKNIVWEFRCASPLNAKGLPNGNVLVGEYGGQRVKEVDRDKNVVWDHKARTSVCDVHRLLNGNTLIAELNRIVEVTPDSKEVWEFGLNQGQFYGCQPLPNGNVLVANLNGKVVEVTRDKKTVWEHTVPSACDVFRLPNGNTLITNNSTSIEVTPDKKTVWSRGNFSYGTARR